MNTVDYIGLTGAIIAGIAYIPQIRHLITEKCAAGISRGAFALWLVASVFVMINAVFTRSVAFMVLSTVQIVSTVIIITFSTRYAGQTCEYHQEHPGAA